jgi:hypothetical protein
MNENGVLTTGGQLAVREAPIAVSSARHSRDNPASSHLPAVEDDPRQTPPSSFTRDDCLVANGLERPPRARRVADGRRPPELNRTTPTLPTICGPRVSRAVPNYPPARSLSLDPPSLTILYHGTLRTPQRRIPLDDNRSAERRY